MDTLLEEYFNHRTVVGTRACLPYAAKVITRNSLEWDSGNAYPHPSQPYVVDTRGTPARTLRRRPLANIQYRNGWKLDGPSMDSTKLSLSGKDIQQGLCDARDNGTRVV